MPQKKKKKDSPTEEQRREWEMDFLGISPQERASGNLTPEHKDMLTSYRKSLDQLRKGAIAYMDRRSEKGLGTYKIDRHIAVKDFKDKGGYEAIIDKFGVKKEEPPTPPIVPPKPLTAIKYTTAYGSKKLEPTELAKYRYTYALKQIKIPSKTGVHVVTGRQIVKKEFLETVVADTLEQVFSGIPKDQLTDSAKKRLRGIKGPKGR